MKRRFLSFGMCLGLSAAMSGAGCNPTPDYRVAVLDIPSDAAVLLIGWKSEEGNRASKTSLAVPLAGLGAEARARYVIGLDLLDAPGNLGVISVGTVSPQGCLLSVASSSPTERSSRVSVPTVEIELDPAKNPAAVQRDPLPSPMIQCPPEGMILPYPQQVACQTVPGLEVLPTEPKLIPTKPVVINTIRELRGPARVYDSGKFAFYGWGFDSPRLEFGPNCDPSMCGLNLAKANPQYAPMLAMKYNFGYPNLRPISYSQLELDVAAVKAELKVEPAIGLQDGLIQCIAVSALSFRLVNLDGSSASYAEILHKK
jgi:hypothetical protein